MKNHQEKKWGKENGQVGTDSEEKGALPYESFHIEKTEQLDSLSISNLIINRVNRVSSLYQMFGVLEDVVLFTKDGKFKYFPDVPASFLPKLAKYYDSIFPNLFDLRGFFTLQFNYGKKFLIKNNF